MCFAYPCLLLAVSYLLSRINVYLPIPDLYTVYRSSCIHQPEQGCLLQSFLRVCATGRILPQFGHCYSCGYCGKSDYDHCHVPSKNGLCKTLWAVMECLLWCSCCPKLLNCHTFHKSRWNTHRRSSMVRSTFRGSIGFSWSARFASQRRIAMYAPISSPTPSPIPSRNEADLAVSLDHEARRSLRCLCHPCDLHYDFHGVSCSLDRLAPAFPGRLCRLPGFWHPRRSLSFICSNESPKRRMVHALSRASIVEYLRPMALWEGEPMACRRRG